MSQGNGGFYSRPEQSCPEKANQLWEKIKDDSGHSSKEGAIIVLRMFAIYTIALPPLKTYHNGFQDMYKDAIIDRDMKSDLEQAGVINWCRTAKKLYPLKTTGDGNCLLHAVSQYLWGVEDSSMYLRRIMYINVTQDPNETFKRRWLIKQRANEARLQVLDRLNTEDYTVEWETVIKGTEDMAQNGPNGLPFTSLESIHLYILANMLKRPIILLADNAARSVYGQSLQENDLSGIYLPLDIPASQCSKNPVILGYNLSHFAPLISEEDSPPDSRGSQRELAVPLVDKDLGMLSLQYLLPGEERRAMELMNQYLQLKELVYSQRDNIMTVPSAEINHLPLQPEFNIMLDFRRDCELKYRYMLHQEPLLRPRNNAPVQESMEPYLELAMNPQEGQVAPTANRAPQPVVAQQHRAAPQPVAVKPRPHISEGEQYQKLQQQQKKCIIVGCDHYGSAEYSSMCFSCFKDFTVQFHKQELQAKQGQRREPDYHDLSMMGELCKAGCGFRCSTETYPFCHECQPKFEARNLPPLQVGQELPPNSMLPENCHRPGCDNYCSQATYPFCHVCFNENLKQVAKPPTAPPPPSFPQGLAQVGTGHAVSDETQVVQVGVNKMQVTKRPVNPMMPAGLDLQQPTGQLDKKCSTESCSNFAMKGNNGKCENCYSHTMFGSGASPTNHKICVTPHCGKPVIWQTDKCKQCFVDDGRIPRDPSRPQHLPPNIMSPADEKILNSVPEPGSRPQPLQHDEKGAMPPPPIAGQSKYICARPGCEGQRAQNTDLCYNCWNLENAAGRQTPQPESALEVSCTPMVFSEEELKKLNPLVVSSRQKIQCASPICGNMIYPPKKLCDTCSDVLAKSKASQRLTESIAEGSTKCHTPGCKFFGSLKFRGFCSKCFASINKDDMRRHTAPIAGNRPEVSDVKHQTAPLSTKQEGKLCIELNCQRFGDPNEGDRCSQHYAEAIKKIPQSPKTDFKHRIHPSQSQPQIQQPRPSAGIAAEAKEPRPVQHREVDKYYSGLCKLESSQKSTNLCKSNARTGCTNYGNSKNKGYCNTCFPEVQRLERTQKPILPGVNQFG